MTGEELMRCTKSDFNPQRGESTNAEPGNRSDRKAEPGAKRSGATGSMLNTLNGRAPRFRLFVVGHADPVAPLCFAPGSAFLDPRTYYAPLALIDVIRRA